MGKYNRTVVAVVSDTHGGSSLGLCNPATELQDDAGKIKYPTLTTPQDFLWGLYMSGIDLITDLAGEDDIVVLHLGDNTHGVKYISEQSTTRIADQFLIAQWNMIPWLEHPNVKAVRFAKGTSSHVFGEGSAEILVEKLLQGRYPDRDIRTIYHGLSNISGVTFDYSHHGPSTGSRNWLAGNEARYYLRSLMMTEIQAGRKPPDIVLRGHYHSYVKETLWMDTVLGECESSLYVVPSMTFADDYTRKATKSGFQMTNGMVCFEVVNGRVLQSYKFMETTDIRTKEDVL